MEDDKNKCCHDFEDSACPCKDEEGNKTCHTEENDGCSNCENGGCTPPQPD